MATTTNYAWTTPDNSGLVKNGAQDIRTLGSAVDTSLWNVGFGQAGKNKVINADFGIWQRGTSFTTADVYTADRWVMSLSGATATTSRQSFTVGQTDVPNNPTYFLRYAASVGDNNARIMYRGEDVTTFSNVTTTLSFWAKGTNPAGGSMALLLTQYFGAAGSTAVDTTIGSFTLTGSWQRFTFTFTPPSVSGKTITAGNYFSLDFRQPNGDTGTAAWTLDLSNVQWEYGSKATPFQTATGTLQGELAACQRYYQRITSPDYGPFIFMTASSATNLEGVVQFINQMRTSPTFAKGGTAMVYPPLLDRSAPTQAALYATTSGKTAQYTYKNNNGSGDGTSYLEFSAEL